MTTHSNFFVLNLKLGVQTNCPLAWMFFLTLATAFPMKTVCSCWIWKLSNDACPLNLIHSASFLTQSNWLEKKSYQLHLVRIEALGTKLIPTKTMVRCYVISNAQMVSNAFYTPKVGLGYMENSTISLQKKIDINMVAWLCLGHYAFHNSVSFLDYSFLFSILICYFRQVYCMSSFPIVTIALTSLVKDTLPSASLVKQQACVVS